MVEGVVIRRQPIKGVGGQGLRALAILDGRMFHNLYQNRLEGPIACHVLLQNPRFLKTIWLKSAMVSPKRSTRCLWLMHHVMVVVPSNTSPSTVEHREFITCCFSPLHRLRAHRPQLHPEARSSKPEPRHPKPKSCSFVVNTNACNQNPNPEPLHPIPDPRNPKSRPRHPKPGAGCVA